ncbi:MAG: glycine zipper 2TM domain-containing protein [Sphingomonadales bacterium]|nr:glycine zipper 2TM domain-containing protein [Sphingomonadales bacterium]
MTAKTLLSLTAAATMVVTSLGVATPAAARDHYRDYRGDYGRDYRYRDRDYRDARYYRDNRYAYGDRYRYGCKNDGSTGTIIGAIAGGLAGHEIVGRRGDKTAGTIIGGAVGAIAGRAIDKSDSRCR